MRKIKTLFLRDPANPKHVLPEVNPACAWVLAGEGTATRKWDGTCVLVRCGAMFARREVKPGKQAPPDFELCETDPVTGMSVGWVPVTEAPEWARHWEAYRNTPGEGDVTLSVSDGTYELCGPKVNGNPEGFVEHVLIRHGAERFDALWDDPPPRDFVGLHHWLLDHDCEGIVWWREPGNPDAGLAKLKRRDFA
jgi:hypothetical protein